MPTLTATAYPTQGYVLIKGDWTDTANSNAGFVAVYRVNELTGEEVLLRPYVAYNSSGCEMLHCGKVLFWDTEVPLNTPVHYRGDVCFPITTGQRQPLGYDTFGRIDAATWTTSDGGEAWTFQGSGTRSINGTEGVMSFAAANATQREVMFSVLAGGDGVVTARGRIPVVPVGGLQAMGLVGRYTDDSNKYYGELSIAVGGALTANLIRSVGGVNTTLATTALTQYTHVANQVYNMAFTLSGTNLGFKAWPITTPEPAFSQVFATDATFGSVVPLAPGIRSVVGAGATVPADFFYDQFVAFGSGATSATVTSNTVTVATEAIFLKSPLHPCSDVTIVGCMGARPFECEDPNVREVMFQSMSEEGFEPNTVNLAPVNRRRVIPVNRERRDIDATLTLVTRTFADRDALRLANQPGDPLLFQAPSAYGIADRYMSIGRVTEARGVPDHKFQPRLVAMPHVVVDRPEGAADGVCGARFEDLCDLYNSWDSISLAGLTWEDLLEGDAGSGGPNQPPVSAQRTWQDVLDDFATWGAVNDGVRTWQGLRDGA